MQGIKPSELKLAEGSIPDSRNGIQAWLKEGCMPIWGTVSEKRYLRERSSNGSFVFLVESFCFEIYVKIWCLDGGLNEYGDDQSGDTDAGTDAPRDEHGDDIPEYVKEPRHYWMLLVKSINKFFSYYGQ